MTPEQQARQQIDKMLSAAGWLVQDAAAANIQAGPGVAIREFPLPGFGLADYLLYVDGKAAGVIEAKKEGATLSGVEIQAAKYTKGLPATLPAWRSPLPFCYQSTGIETRFTNGLEPAPRARSVFAFHRPEVLRYWLDETGLTEEGVGEAPPPSYAGEGSATFLARLRQMPELVTEGLWPAQIKAINNLEKSLRENRPGKAFWGCADYPKCRGTRDL
jgi:type I restriction enzyme R subunit